MTQGGPSPRAHKQIDGLIWEGDFAAGVQFLRQQAVIDVRVSRRGDLRLAAETHHRSIPIFQLARLAVDNIALQGRRPPGGHRRTSWCQQPP